MGTDRVSTASVAETDILIVIPLTFKTIFLGQILFIPIYPNYPKILKATLKSEWLNEIKSDLKTGRCLDINLQDGESLKT